MRNLIQKRKSEGFTIIEVMIVLAIAGLILLIVFLAVPALQRNAHNTSMKNDVASALGAVTEYSNNNNGTLPTTASFAAPVLTVGAAGKNQSTANLGYATVVNLTTLASGTKSAPANTGDVEIYTQATCDASVAGQADFTSGRSIAAIFTLEGGAKQCQSS